MQSIISVRPARPSDVSLIVALIRDLAIYEKLEHECFADPDALSRHLFGPAPRAEVLIAQVRDEAVGFALFFHSYSTFLTKPGIYLEDLFVKPEFRGSGAGRALLSELARITLERNCGRLEWSVLTWNEPAIGFYRSLGAVPMEGWQMFRLTGPPLAALGGGS